MIEFQKFRLLIALNCPLVKCNIPVDSGEFLQIPVDSCRFWWIPVDSCRNGGGTVKYWI